MSLFYCMCTVDVQRNVLYPGMVMSDSFLIGLPVVLHIYSLILGSQVAVERAVT